MKKFFFLITILTTLSVQSQSNPSKELGAWYMFHGNHILSEKYSIKTMAHFRFYELASEIRQLVTRAGLNYKINDHFSVTGGIFYAETDTSYKQVTGTVNEFRLYEDFNTKHKISSVGIANRIRFEHRFIEDGNTIHWFRHQLSTNYPLADKWSLDVYNELFLSFNGDTYVQDWLGGKFNYTVSKSVKLAFGYQRIFRKAGDFDRMLLGVYFTTRPKKK